MKLDLKPEWKEKMLRALTECDRAYTTDGAGRCWLQFDEMRFCVDREIKFFWHGRQVHTLTAPPQHPTDELTLNGFEGRFGVEITT